jgi:hypothetical protein
MKTRYQTEHNCSKLLDEVARIVKLPKGKHLLKHLKGIMGRLDTDNGVEYNNTMDRTDKIDLEGGYDDFLRKCPDCGIEMVEVDNHTRVCPKCNLTISKEPND